MALIRLEPAASVLKLIGVGKTSEITGVGRTQVWRWTQPKSKRGTGGTIPQDHHPVILDYAKKKRLPITAASLIKSSLRSVSVARRKSADGHNPSPRILPR